MVYMAILCTKGYMTKHLFYDNMFKIEQIDNIRATKDQ